MVGGKVEGRIQHTGSIDLKEVTISETRGIYRKRKEKESTDDKITKEINSNVGRSTKQGRINRVGKVRTGEKGN